MVGYCFGFVLEAGGVDYVAADQDSFVSTDSVADGALDVPVELNVDRAFLVAEGEDGFHDAVDVDH